MIKRIPVESEVLSTGKLAIHSVKEPTNLTDTLIELNGKQYLSVNHPVRFRNLISRRQAIYGDYKTGKQTTIPIEVIRNNPISYFERNFITENARYSLDEDFKLRTYSFVTGSVKYPQVEGAKVDKIAGIKEVHYDLAFMYLITKNLNGLQKLISEEGIEAQGGLRLVLSFVPEELRSREAIGFMSDRITGVRNK